METTSWVSISKYTWNRTFTGPNQRHQKQKSRLPKTKLFKCNKRTAYWLAPMLSLGTFLHNPLIRSTAKPLYGFERITKDKNGRKNRIFGSHSMKNRLKASKLLTIKNDTDLLLIIRIISHLCMFDVGCWTLLTLCVLFVLYVTHVCVSYAIGYWQRCSTICTNTIFYNVHVNWLQLNDPEHGRIRCWFAFLITIHVPNFFGSCLTNAK